MRVLRSQGDTIVEVLIAIMIVTTVIAASYVTVSRVTNNARQAQERGVGTKLLEAQAERIKAYAASTSAATLFGASNPFCLDAASVFTSLGGFTLPQPLDTDPFTGYGGCVFDQRGEAYVAASPGVEYYIVTFRNGNTFTITARWTKAGGYGKEQATISYRVYPL